jgi:hypothetical protein
VSRYGGAGIRRLFEAGQPFGFTGRPGIAGWFAQMIDNLVGREEVMDLD